MIEAMIGFFLIIATVLISCTVVQTVGTFCIRIWALLKQCDFVSKIITKFYLMKGNTNNGK
jgi:hypothetical protein